MVSGELVIAAFACWIVAAIQRKETTLENKTLPGHNFC
jgi:hypothetical protein